MKRSINILIGILVFQSALYAFLTYRDYANTNSTKKSEPLLAVNFDTLDKVVVEAGDKKSLELLKKDGKWVIPSLFNIPMANEKLTQVFKFLTEAKRSWPMGNTKAAAKQFELTDEKFERKLSFFSEGKLVNTLFLGNSPTYRKVYARVDNEDKSFSVEFNTIDAPTDAKEWADHSLYKMDRTKIAEIQFPGFRIVKEGSSLVPAGLKADETTNATEMDNFLTKIQNPLFEDVLGSDSYETGDKVLEYTITTDDKAAHSFHYFAMKTDANTSKDPANDFVVLKVSNIPYAFKVRRARADELLKFTQSTFAKKKEADQAPKGLGNEAGQIHVPAGGPG